MKVFKKIAAILSAAVIAVTAAASMAVTVGADSIANTATAITSGKAYDCEFVSTSSETCDFKLNVKASGVLSVKLNGSLRRVQVELYDSDFNEVTIADYSISSGKQASSSTGLSISGAYVWNSVGEKLNCTTTWKVNKGIYYLRVCNAYGKMGGATGTLKLTATYPSGTSSSGSSSTSTAKVYYIVLYLEKGDRLSLGATITKGAKVTWKSSNTSVASVSSSGKLTAKGKGSAIITAKCGSSSKNIKVIVS